MANRGNPYRMKGKFGSASNHDKVIYEPNKDHQIQSTEKEGAILNSDTQKLAALLGIELEQKDNIDQEILITQLSGLRDIADEFPQVEELMKKYYKHGLHVVVEPFKASDKIGEHNSKDSFADTAPSTGIISLNSISEKFKGSLENAQEIALRQGRRTKFGAPIISTSDIRHTIVHEYAHIMQYMLANKWNDSIVEMIANVKQLTGIKEFPTTLSAYANKNKNEFFSEAIAQAFLEPDTASPEAKAIYKIFKKELE